MRHQVVGKLYELRYYRLAAQEVARMRSLVQDVFRVRVRHSRVIGFWATELGALNHVFHIWEYDSLTARKAARDALAGDQDWANRFLKLALPAFELQENCVTKPLIGDLESAWSDQEFYKVLTVNYHGVSQGEARQKFLESAQQLELQQQQQQQQQQRPVVRGAFETVIGRSREFNILQSAKNLDDLVGREDPFTSDPTAATYSKVLYPYQWSRWLHD